MSRVKAIVGASLLVAVGMSGPSLAAGAPADDLAALIRPLRPSATGARLQAEPSRVTWSDRGGLRYLGAPQGTAFPVPDPSAEPAASAAGFLRAHRELLGLRSEAVDFVLVAQRTRGERSYLRFQQTYAGIPVFAARMNVQLGAANGIEAVLADLATDLGELDSGRISTRPALTEADAVARALALGQSRAPRGRFETRVPQLRIFSPEVLGSTGPPRLVWDVSLGSFDRPAASARLLIDAHEGAIVREYPLEISALDREIYDANNFIGWNGNLVRDEGDPPSGIADADAAYDRIAETRLFYAQHHGRDGIDGLGATLKATVRFCADDAPCPWSNASWSSYWQTMRFGEGWVRDDILAHEYTHGVTEHESALVYENASGAINESFSDVWGEFVDLGNGQGNDGSAVRWEIGEDLGQGAVRDMSDPPAHGDPDRLGSGLYVSPVPNPNPDNDYGGVHTNSGVGNKLCYLLTDGGVFNGQSMSPMGVAAIADLFYEVNANLLPSAADWTDLSDALRQAAVNLGWSAADRANLDRACVAVEIAAFIVDGVSICPHQTGAPACGFQSGPYHSVSAGLAGVPDGATISIRAGNYPETLWSNKRARLQAEGGAVRIGP